MEYVVYTNLDESTKLMVGIMLISTIGLIVLYVAIVTVVDYLKNKFKK